jgi:hypothetical protein
MFEHRPPPALLVVAYRILSLPPSGGRVLGADLKVRDGDPLCIRRDGLDRPRGDPNILGCPRGVTWSDRATLRKIAPRNGAIALREKGKEEQFQKRNRDMPKGAVQNAHHGSLSVSDM